MVYLQNLFSNFPVFVYDRIYDNDAWSLRFTARYSKSVKKVHFYCYSKVGSYITHRIGLMEDVNGLPSWEWLGYANHYLTATGNRVVEFSPTIPLKAGSVYHLVFTWSGTGTKPDSSNYAYLFLYVSPVFRYIPTFQPLLYDSKLSALYFINKVYQDIGTYSPIFVLEFDDGSFYGQPYIGDAYEAVYGSIWIAEHIKMPTTLRIKSVGVCAAKTGNPPNLLSCSIYSITDGVELGSVSFTGYKSYYALLESTLSSPITLHKSKEYRFIFKTTGGDSSNCYNVLGFTTSTLDAFRYCTYLRDDAYYEKSTNAGSSWTSAIDADMFTRAKIVPVNALTLVG
jgi:hypothetical protein